jgi:tRNA nucleotidyltransferase (CCA-adding enzyme)
MATYSFERLPVLKQGRLIGIVTRADLVRSLFQFQTYRAPGEKDADRGFLWMEGIGGLLEQAFSTEQRALLERIGRRAQELGMKAYIVGGAVRDILKGEKNIDLDISVEGDAEVLVQSWDEPGCRSTVHGRYKTGTIVFPDGNKVDIATARREFYEYAAAMPEVSSDSLKQDLARRDFSVNAMAVSLSEENWGTLIDFYGGRRDLKEGILRVLHNLSLVEDPSRILRGTRLEQRLGLAFEDNTLRLIRSAIKGGLLGKLSGPRVRMELEIDFRERWPKRIARRHQALGIWEAIFPGLRFGPAAEKKFGRLQTLLPRAKKAGVNFKETEWLAYMAALLSDTPAGAQSSAMDRLALTPLERDAINTCLAAPAAVEQFISSKKNFRNSEVYLFLKKYEPATLVYCMASVKRRQTRRWIARHALSFVPTKRELTGRDLLVMGHRPGPWVGEILETIRLERMDGSIKTREDELQYLNDSLMRR